MSENGMRVERRRCSISPRCLWKAIISISVVEGLFESAASFGASFERAEIESSISPSWYGWLKYSGLCLEMGASCSGGYDEISDEIRSPLWY